MSRPLIVVLFLLLTCPAFSQEHGLKVPPGFKVTLVADHTLANDIYCMTLDDKGRIIVSSRGWVKRLHDSDGDGVMDRAEVLHETVSGAMGLLWDQGWLYMNSDGWLTRLFVGPAPPERIALPSAKKVDFESPARAMRVLSTDAGSGIELWGWSLPLQPTAKDRSKSRWVDDGIEPQRAISETNRLPIDDVTVERNFRPFSENQLLLRDAIRAFNFEKAQPPQTDGVTANDLLPDAIAQIPNRSRRSSYAPQETLTVMPREVPERADSAASPALGQALKIMESSDLSFSAWFSGLRLAPTLTNDRYLGSFPSKSVQGAFAVGNAEGKRPSLDGSRPGRQEFLLPLAFGEHGAHAIRKGPDGRFYVICGNNANLHTVPLSSSSPVKHPEAGGILRFTPGSSRTMECIAHGFRNPYDFDFTPLGDIITYDSDTERDYLLPWYSPTRFYHVAYGQHHGWRLPGYLRSLARPDYYPDTVDILAPNGRGSPTGLTCYRHVLFPKRYHGGVFACDWTFGKIFYLPLEVSGSTYKGKPEVFLEPVGGSGFAPTDICVAPDGSLLVSIGGRGTRGAVYRIEYVGTPEEPAGKYEEPQSDLLKVLDAPQPLDAWSRGRWEPLAQRINEKDFVAAADDSVHTVVRVVRALQILSGERIGSNYLIHDRTPKPIDSNITPEALSNVARLMGKSFWSSSSDELFLRYVLRNPQSRVRCAALEAISENMGSSPTSWGDPRLIHADLAKSLHAYLTDDDKRVRMAAARVYEQMPAEQRTSCEGMTTPAARLAVLAGTSLPQSAKDAAGTAWAALDSRDDKRRVDALRLLMRAQGDWNIDNPPEEVYAAYSLRNPILARDELTRYWLRRLYPSRDRNFNIEAARYFAMIEDDDPEVLAKVLARITPESDPTDDLHHIIVLSRLTAKATVDDTKKVVQALLGLDRKFAGKQMRIKQNFGPRLGEVVFNLLLRYPGLSRALLDHPEFVNPAHVALAVPFGREDRIVAARLFLAAVRKGADFPWSPDLVKLLGELPADDWKPEFRKQWSDFSLRGELLKYLARDAEEVDRGRFLEAVESLDKPTALAALRALNTLPPDRSAENLTPLIRRLRESIPEEKEADLRARLLDLVNRQTGKDFHVLEMLVEKPEIVLRDARLRKGVYDPLFDWFRQAHPAEFARSRNDEERFDAWKKALDAVRWEGGNEERGLKLFQTRSCAACHTGSSRVGPDLVGAAGRFSRDDLFGAIISPSRDVAPAFRVNEIETQDGKRYSGIVVFESADGIIVQLDAVNTVRIDTADILSRQPGRKSLMPSGLLKDLKPDDLADLYAYLKSLK